MSIILINEPPHGKTNNLHMQKPKAQISFAVPLFSLLYADSTVPLLLKSEISTF